MKLLPHILFQKCIFIIALEMASPGNRHCAICIGTLSFAPLLPAASAAAAFHWRFRWWQMPTLLSWTRHSNWRLRPREEYTVKARNYRSAAFYCSIYLLRWRRSSLFRLAYSAPAKWLEYRLRIWRASSNVVTCESTGTDIAREGRRTEVLRRKWCKSCSVNN